MAVPAAGYQCADALATYFARPTDSRALNHRTGALEQRMLTGSFRDAQGKEWFEWLILETFPFKPGYVTRKFYRAVTEDASLTPAGDLTQQQRWDLVRPHVHFAKGKYGLRRDWTAVMLQDLDVIGEAYVIDSVYVWVEEQTTHDIVGTIRIINAPEGILVREMYGVSDVTRDPLEQTPDGIRCRVQTPETRFAAPRYLPEEFLMGIVLNREPGANLAGEVGCLAVEETLPEPFRTEVEHELWLHLSREFHRYHWVTEKVRYHTYADRRSLPLYRGWHGLVPCNEYTLNPGTICRNGRIFAEERWWTPMMITPTSLEAHNRRIFRGEHRMFEPAAVRARRPDTFRVERNFFDGAFLGDFEALFAVADSANSWERAAALGNIITNVEHLLRLPGGRDTLRAQAPAIEAGVARLVRSPERSVAMRSGFLVDFLLLSAHAEYFDAPRLRRLLLETLLNPDGWIVDENLPNLYNAVNPRHVPWPRATRSVPPALAGLARQMREFLQAEARVVGQDIYFDRIARARAGVFLALLDERPNLDLDTLHEIVAHALSR